MGEKSDIVNRLRQINLMDREIERIIDEAADRIELLTAALKQIADGPSFDPANRFLADDMHRLARRVLEQSEEGHMKPEYRVVLPSRDELLAEIERLRALIHPFEGAIVKVEEQGDEIDRLKLLLKRWVVGYSHEEHDLLAESRHALGEKCHGS